MLSEEGMRVSVWVDEWRNTTWHITHTFVDSWYWWIHACMYLHGHLCGQISQPIVQQGCNMTHCISFFNNFAMFSVILPCLLYLCILLLPLYISLVMSHYLRTVPRGARAAFRSGLGLGLQLHKKLEITLKLRHVSTSSKTCTVLCHHHIHMSSHAFSAHWHMLPHMLGSIASLRERSDPSD